MRNEEELKVFIDWRSMTNLKAGKRIRATELISGYSQLWRHAFLPLHVNSWMLDETAQPPSTIHLGFMRCMLVLDILSVC
jgi:hypothetical protein